MIFFFQGASLFSHMCQDTFEAHHRNDGERIQLQSASIKHVYNVILIHSILLLLEHTLSVQVLIRFTQYFNPEAESEESTKPEV